MSYYPTERKTWWERMLEIFKAFFDALRRGFTDLIDYYRNLLANYGYSTTA